MKCDIGARRGQEAGMGLAFQTSMQFSPATPKFFAGFFLLAIVALALVAPVRAVAFISRDSMNLDIQNVVPVLPKQDIDAQKVGMVVPTDIRSGAGSDEVSQKILDRSMQSVLEGKMINNEFLRSAKKLETAMKPNLSFGQSPSGVKHEIQMEYQAFQNKAKLGYKGLFDASANYDLGNRNTDFSVGRNLSSATKLSLGCVANPTSSVEMLTIQWKW